MPCDMDSIDGAICFDEPADWSICDEETYDLSTGGSVKRRFASEEEDDGSVKKARLEEEEASEEEDAVSFRRPVLWSPQMRWKDERRKVLKLTTHKLNAIEDPEVFLGRSVLINNLSRRIRDEIATEIDRARARVDDMFLGCCGAQYRDTGSERVAYPSLVET